MKRIFAILLLIALIPTQAFGAFFFYRGIGTNAGGGSAAFNASLFTMPENGTATSISVYTSSATNVKAGIYQNAGTGNAGFFYTAGQRLVAENTGTACSAGAWCTIPITPTFLPKGRYWIATVESVASVLRYYANLPLTETQYNLGSNYAAGIPVTPPAPTYQAFTYAKYVNYTPGGSESINLKKGLVSYWTLNEQSGTRNDSWGTNHLTDENTVSYGAGKVNNSANFIAANSEDLTVADNASLDFTASMSLSFWIKRTTIVGDIAFFGKWTFATAGGWAVQSRGGVVPSQGVGTITMFIATTAGDSGSTRATWYDTNMQAGVWYHCVVVYDGAALPAGINGNLNRIKLYINGQLQDRVQIDATIPATLLNSTAPLYFGRFGGSLTRYFNGDLDEVGMWSRPLNQSEVTALYNNGRAWPLSFYDILPFTRVMVKGKTIIKGAQTTVIR